MALPTERETLEALERVARATKAFDGAASWRRQANRDAERLILTCALRLDGVLAGGVSVRLKTPAEVWEEAVYGHVEVRIPGIPRALRLDPVEWRPLRPHTNPPDAAGGLAALSLWDRHHPAAINIPLGLSVLQQESTGIAAPLPRDIHTYRDYVNLCAEIWRCPDMRTVGMPPWTPSLI